MRVAHIFVIKVTRVSRRRTPAFIKIWMVTAVHMLAKSSKEIWVRAWVTKLRTELLEEFIVLRCHGLSLVLIAVLGQKGRQDWCLKWRVSTIILYIIRYVGSQRCKMCCESFLLMFSICVIKHATIWLVLDADIVLENPLGPDLWLIRHLYWALILLGQLVWMVCSTSRKLLIFVSLFSETQIMIRICDWILLVEACKLWLL